MSSPAPHLTPVSLEGELTIYRAQELHRQLRDAVAQAGPGLALQLNQVSEIDSSAVQLLLATRRALARAGRGFRLEGVTDEVRQVLALLGLDHGDELGALAPRTE